MQQVIMAQKVPLHSADRSFDVRFWQAQDSTARFQAAWELIEHYLKRKGRTDELRLQRTVVSFQRRSR